jgi:hypothetical protein
MKPLALAVAALVLSGCVPAQPPAETLPARPITSSIPADAASCKRAGGLIKPVGRMQTLQCVLTYADAGKSCSSGDQCMGECRAGSGTDAVPGQRVAGSCQATSDRFGCSTRVENGRAQATICID